MDNSNLKTVLSPSIQVTKIPNNISLAELFELKKKQLGLSGRKIQNILRIDGNTLKPILDGSARQVNFLNVIKLANFLGLNLKDIASKLYLNNPQTIGEIQDARDAGYIAENFDIKELTKSGFFQDGDTAREMVEKVKEFFNLENLYDYDKDILSPAFSRTKVSSSDKMRNFWIRSAYTKFKLLDNPNVYDRNKFMELVAKIRPYTRNVEKGLVTVIKALFSVGVTVIYQPSLKNVQVRGATLVINGKPCIVLSNLNNRYPTLWFALMHEIYHVVCDFDSIQSTVYHISSDEDYDVFLNNESAADNFAQEYLLSRDKFEFVKVFINSPYEVSEYAKMWNIHPSIIYSTYCYKYHAWAKYSNYIPTMDKAIRYVNVSHGEYAPLKEEVNELVKIINQ